MFLTASKNRLSNSVIKQIKSQFSNNINTILSKEYILESVKDINNNNYILRNNMPIFIIVNNKYIPLVKTIHLLPDLLNKVIIDSGAIKYLINGADLMAPGLLHSTSTYPLVTVGEIVSVYGYGKKSALGVGVVLMDNVMVNEERNGVAVKMISCLGDKIYSLG